jgi:hypothetical protein
MRKLALLTIVCAVLVGAVAQAGLADGDPASDVLYFQDVFLPYQAPAQAVASQLTSTVAAANKAGLRIKVAVIGTAQDLGSIPSLFNQPTTYAHFLGVELKLFYTSRLLVVMPAGFGIYNNGRPTSKETAALATVKIATTDSDGLTQAATTAVQTLQKTIGVQRGSGKGPTVTAMPSSGHKGQTVALRYRVYSPSGRSRETVRVYGPGYLLFATITTRLAKAKPKRTTAVKWNVPADLQTTKLQFCVLAQDAHGNQSKTSCAPLKIA